LHRAPGRQPSRRAAPLAPEGPASCRAHAIVSRAAARVESALFATHERGSEMAETTQAKEEPRRKTKAPTPRGKAEACKIEGCKRAYQAKGYCFFHYDKWKAGELPKARYKTCSKEGCLKKVVAHGLCAEHQGKKEKAPEAAAPAAPKAEAPAT